MRTQKAITLANAIKDSNLMLLMDLYAMTLMNVLYIVPTNAHTIARTHMEITVAAVQQDMKLTAMVSRAVISMNVIKEFTVANNCVITLKAVTFVPVHQGMNWKGALTAKILMNVRRIHQSVSRNVTTLLEITFVVVTMVSGKIPPTDSSVMTLMNVLKTVLVACTIA